VGGGRCVCAELASFVRAQSHSRRNRDRRVTSATWLTAAVWMARPAEHLSAMIVTQQDTRCPACDRHGYESRHKTSLFRRQAGLLDYLHTVWTSRKTLTCCCCHVLSCSPAYCVLPGCWMARWHQQFTGLGISHLRSTTAGK
jgi:hypothetical protein